MAREDDRSTALRMRLASVGIHLDPAVGDRDVKPPIAPSEAPVDRAKIRAILVSRGAPERSIDWLAASCPNERKAWGYKPPRF